MATRSAKTPTPSFLPTPNGIKIKSGVKAGGVRAAPPPEQVEVIPG